MSRAKKAALRLVTWNINSVRLRLALLAKLKAALDPDIVCLQETKCEDRHFPHEGIAALGFAHRQICGNKGYNGVAILSRLPLHEVERRSWCGRLDGRHMAAGVNWQGRPLTIHNFYVPAGGDVPDPKDNEKFAHKLEFLAEMAAWSKATAKSSGPSVLVGDLNVAPLPTDVWSHTALLKVVSHTPVEVERMVRILAARPWVDAVRHFVPESERLYTWWSYRARDWAASDRGRRLDHIWVTRELSSQLRETKILKPARDWPQPSDHVPVMVTIAPP